MTTKKSQSTINEELNSLKNSSPRYLFRCEWELSGFIGEDYFSFTSALEYLKEFINEKDDEDLKAKYSNFVIFVDDMHEGKYEIKNVFKISGKRILKLRELGLHF